MYARVVDNTVLEVGTPTRRPIEFGGRWWDCRVESERDAYITAANWLEIDEVPRPADTATHTTDLTHTVVAGVPTQVWTSRPFTPAELAGNASGQARAQLSDPVTLEARLDRLEAYKTDPEIVAALARANTTAISTQEMNRLIKVILRRQQRQDAALALLVRRIDPALLADISDTVDN